MRRAIQDSTAGGKGPGTIKGVAVLCPAMSRTNHRSRGATTAANHSGGPQVYSADEVRQAQIVLQSQRQRWIFIGGLALGLVLAIGGVAWIVAS